MATTNDDDPTRLLADLDFVRAVARQLCRDDDDADDLAQDTLVRALDRPPGHGGSRRGWLATVARNLFKNRLRDDARRLERERRREPAELEVPSTEEVVALEQQRRLVVEAVLALPERYREVVLLRHFRGVDVPTSARRLGLSETAVRTRLSRANLMLKDYLDRRHGGDRARWVTALLPLTVPTPRDAVVVAAATAEGGKLLGALVATALALGLGVVSWSAASPSATVVPDARGPTPARSARAGATAPADELDRPAPSPDVPDRVLATPEAPSENDLPDLHGFVRRHDDEAVADVPVRVRAQVGEHGGPRERVDLGVVHSDADGRFDVSLEPLRALTSVARSQVHLHASTVELEHFTYEQDMVALADLLPGPLDEPAFQLVLLESPALIARVLTADGREAGGASVYFFDDDDISDNCEQDGRVAHEVGYDLEAGQDVVVYAADRRFGISEPHRVRILADRHTTVPDMVLHPAPTRVEGTVLWPDGTGAAGIGVRFERLPDDGGTNRIPQPAQDLHTVTGRVAHADEWLFPSVDTDADGNFAIAFLRPGRYSFEFGTAEPFQFVVLAEVVTRIDHRMRAPDDAQLRVDVVDEQGLSLSDTWLALHHWHGARAGAAAARFAAEGASADLLASADRFQQMFFVDEQWFVTEPGAFVIAEAACHDRGPAYVAAQLTPGRCRADLDVVLGPRTATGSLRLDVHGPDGVQLTSPTWVRVCRGHVGHALPVLLPGCEARGGPSSGIGGSWYVLPDDTVLRGLPAGGLTLQVLAAPSVDGDRCTRAPWPIEERFVEIAADEEARVDVTTRPGSHIEIDVIAHDAAKAKLEVGATLWPAGGAPRRERFVTRDRGARSGAFVDGRVHLRSVSALAPGQYRLEVRTNAKLYDAAIPGRNVHWQRTVTLPLAAPVQVQLSQR